MASLRLESPEDLPITAYREQIIDLLKTRQVIVVCGETGSGKSTQLPKFCLQAGLGRRGRIGHTQPRRLAARSIADRLSEELGVELGKQVGYQIRFGDQTTEDTLIKLMTDGILLAETQTDRRLNQYEAIIIDEAHERSLNIDFLLGYLRRLQGRRPDLKIIITSATIDAERFAEHFGDRDGPAPILNVEGRGYPVEMRYLPWEDVAAEGFRGYDLGTHVVAGLDEISRSGDGDVLVFLPTERDIREVSHHVAGHYKRLGLATRNDLLPLYARLPGAEQQRIFHPTGGKRRIIFATNVAESSLTVPGIRYVIDSGTARISRYSARTKVQRLPIEPISRASANQRAGRCGRTGPGICVRLFGQDDFDSRDAFTTPEIRRTSLASVVLRTETLRLGKLADFPLLDPPRDEAIREGIRTLQELGAMDDRHELTEIGWQLGRMPVDPRVGRILLAAAEFGVLPEVLPIAAAMEIQDPRDRPQGKQQAADEAHAEFVHPQSDFLSHLKLWRHYESMRGELSRNKLTRRLRQSFLSPNRMREWADVYRQLRELAAELSRKAGGGKIGPIRFEEDPDKLIEESRSTLVHQALLSGLLSGVATAGDKNEYTGASGLKLFLWPGSGVFDAKPKWIMAAELVETTRQYARTVARIQPGWIESVGPHLLKHSYSDPHWSGKSNGAFCYQRSSLYGLPVVAKRRVPLPPVDPTTARDLLIEKGLVEGELVTSAGFVRHNVRLCEAIASLAAKTRRRDLVVDPFQVQMFYARTLPAEVCDRGRLEKYDRQMPSPDWAATLKNAGDVSRWLQEEPPADEPAALPTPYMRVSDLIESDSEVISQEAFPDELAVGATRLPLTYRFEPGSRRDGVAVRVHRAALSQISDERLGWLVPGLLETKIVAMIKSLPKRLRRNLVPAADVARRVVAELGPLHGEVPFLPALCQALTRHAETPIGEADFQAEKLDEHLEFLVEVVDDSGQELGTARSVEELRRRIGGEATDAGETPTDESEADARWSRSAMVTFDIDELPVEVVRRRGGVKIAQYPTLVDQGGHATTRLAADLPTAERTLAGGLTRLFAITEKKELRSQVRWLPALDQAKMHLGSVISPADLEHALIDLIARVAFVEKQPLVRRSSDFEARRRNRGERIGAATQEIAIWLESLSKAFFGVRKERESPITSQATAMTDIEHQLQWLAPESFMRTVPWHWLKHYPRFFSGIAHRIDKLRSGSAGRDAENQREIQSLWNRWLSGLPEDARNPKSQADSEFRWMIEELRISLFAQPLGTSTKVSTKRCEKLLSK